MASVAYLRLRSVLVLQAVRSSDMRVGTKIHSETSRVTASSADAVLMSGLSEQPDRHGKRYTSFGGMSKQLNNVREVWKTDDKEARGRVNFLLTQ